MAVRSPRKRLRELVAAQVEARPSLPYIHSTDLLSLVNAVEDGQLNPTPCGVFGEDLLYFFYGRPSYRVNSAESPTSLSHYLPVCLLLAPNALKKITRILPFDSGAFNGGLYTDAIHKAMILDDFCLEPQTDTPGRLVSLLFGDISNYLNAQAVEKLIADSSELEAQACHAIASNKLSNIADNRGSGVEIQSSDPVSLKGNVRAIIVPSTFIDNSRVISALKADGVDIITYPQIGRMRPSEYTSEIMTLCSEYCRRHPKS